MNQRDRFAFEIFPDGGVLLDLDTGILFQLNRSAAFVWERTLSDCALPEILDEFRLSFEVSEDVARADVTAALTLPQQQVLAPVIGDYRYELVGDCYRVSLFGVPLMEVAASGASLRILDDMTLMDLPACLAAISPKLVALCGASVLHASAVMRADGQVTALVGQSGAGKTTTARAFGSAGLRLVCEDKLVLRLEGDRVGAVLDGESRIMNWLASTRSRLQQVGADRWCDLDFLKEAGRGPSAPVAEIMTLDSTRRFGTSIELFPLTQSVAACEIFQQGFYGSSEPDEWRRQVRVAATLARTSRAFNASTPNGIEPLTQAVRRYTEMTQS